MRVRSFELRRRCLFSKINFLLLSESHFLWFFRKSHLKLQSFHCRAASTKELLLTMHRLNFDVYSMWLFLDVTKSIVVIAHYVSLSLRWQIVVFASRYLQKSFYVDRSCFAESFFIFFSKQINQLFSINQVCYFETLTIRSL